MGSIVSSPAPRRPRSRRLGIMLGVVLAITTAPALVLASHQFSDVPNSSPFHAQIDALVEAGITAGCTPTTYCPKSPVTREQMAAFLNRGLPYTTAASGVVTASEAEVDFITTVAIPPRGQAGGTAYVEINGSVNVFASGDACPCALYAFAVPVKSKGGGSTAVVLVPPPVDGASAVEATVNWVFEVPTGAAAEFGLAAFLIPLEEPLEPTAPGTEGTVEEPELHGTIVAQYSPFGSAPEPAPILLGGPAEEEAGRLLDALLSR